VLVGRRDATPAFLIIGLHLGGYFARPEGADAGGL
jgi:hypothetical protein